METAPYSNDTTSRDAAASLGAETLARQERVVLSVFLAAHERGTVGLTSEEACDVTGMKWSTMTARIWSLVNERGRLIDSGARRRNRSGRMAIVWRPTVAGEVVKGERMRRAVVVAVEREREAFAEAARAVVRTAVAAGVWSLYAECLPGMETDLGRALRRLEEFAR